MGSITNYILGLSGATVLVLVFLLPAAESSIFVGFIFPGETVVILGGVLASEHRVPIVGVIAAASLGVIIGDSIGYFIGKRWGRRLIDGPLSRVVKKSHIARAEDFFVKRGGPGVFIGRFTTALRVLVPGIAGVSGLSYNTFLIYNISGGIVWAIAMAMLGYAAGQSFQQVQKIAGDISYIVLALVVVGLAIFVVWRKRKEKKIIEGFEVKDSSTNTEQSIDE